MAPSNSSIVLILRNLAKMCCAFLNSFSGANLLLLLVIRRSVGGFGWQKFLRISWMCVPFSWEFAIPWTFEHDDQTHHKQLKRATLSILKIMIIIMTVYLCEAKENSVVYSLIN